MIEEVFEKVESSEADFGITAIDSVPKTMVCHDLFETELKLISSKNNRFFRRKAPTLKQIAQSPLVLFSRTGSIEPFIEKRFHRRGIETPYRDDPQ